MTFEKWRKQDREVRCMTAYSRIVEHEAKWAYMAGQRIAFEEIATLKVVSDHNLATYHQAAQKLRDEIATLKEWNSELVKHQEATADKVDELREQVNIMLAALTAIALDDCLHAATIAQEALDATEQKEIPE